MKKLLSPLLVMVFVATTVFAQSTDTEFDEFDNGLIYSPKTMGQLKYIVDSLNLKFKKCELAKVYYSVPQTIAHHITLSKGKIKQAKDDLENGISFTDFITKYPESEVLNEKLVVKFLYKNYKDKDVVQFATMGINDSYDTRKKISKTGNKDLYYEDITNKWVLKYTEEGKYSDESLEAFYFPSEFKSKPVNDFYARMIQYADCMIDTSSMIFTENAKRSRYSSYSKSKSSKVLDFMNYINEKTNKPIPDNYGEEDTTYWSDYQEWSVSSKAMIADDLSKTDQFKTMLNEALNEAYEKSNSNGYFEDIVGNYVSKDEELKLKRSRVVVGSCSMDDSPRWHAQDIAILSAETANWEVFLRAHLNIMNDRFDRMSDGSYAWEARKTYIKEIEELDINVSELIMGITLRMENPAQNHYYGSVGRLGRALSETKNKVEIEDLMFNMIKDNSLDDYNRIVVCYLLTSYLNYLEDDQKNILKEEIKIAINTLPDYLIPEGMKKD